jgi:hypothetical protein
MSNQLPPFIVNWLSPRRIKIEIILTVVSLMSLFVYALKIEGGAELVMIALSSLSGFYFLSAYLPTEFGAGVLVMISQKLIAFSSAVSVIGLLFSLLKLSGSDEMVLIGFVVMAVGALIFVVSTLKQWDDKLMPLVIRVGVLLTILALVLLKLISF